MPSISCHCGFARQTVRLRGQSPNAPQEISICHCNACRHNTGSLCVSYVEIKKPDLIEGLVKYHSETTIFTRFFCGTCGCHIFRRLGSPFDNDGDRALPGNDKLWAVATGVIIGLEDNSRESRQGIDERLIRYVGHINTASTKDGGLSPFIQCVGSSQEVEVAEIKPASPRHRHTHTIEQLEGSADHVTVNAPLGDKNQGSEGEATMNAFCHCKSVRFHITRPNDKSKLPRSNFPDLMVPYHTGSPEIRNPKDIKWWLRPDISLNSAELESQSARNGKLRRYLAGTCACRSCRLTLGFEIQSWAFIPRANIFFHIRKEQANLPGPQSGTSKDAYGIVPLDFDSLPAGILRSYVSSPGVRRDFCSRCGATVFWRDRWRPELLDVSAGLLDAEEGTRAETWLDWWTARVSFSEDAGNGRTGEMADHASCLINGLETGLRGWGLWEERAEETA
ncbi:hypothetical protein F5B22DRAFT_33439 [Xylaria bambusicola]|uniref:uncharacterized protein n=1 Tax=Xylaria bambusicola TaxID=326684 RepID=UPI0020073650|nr:uncharacterized protein F5B22DRAFT_33439 [Xylaria bambusicola]KAI0520992.1 hypothetical protein F5B22DRAFT_33439 [Xylaria bambusicola]